MSDRPRRERSRSPRVGDGWILRRVCAARATLATSILTIVGCQSPPSEGGELPSDLTALFWWLGSISGLMFIGSLIAIPWLVARIPADYFAHRAPTVIDPNAEHPILRVTWLVFRNLLGLVFIVGGVAMLVLPGQGVISILLGLGLSTFPGKRRLELWIIRRPAVTRAVQWLRRRAGRPPLVIDHFDAPDAAD